METVEAVLSIEVNVDCPHCASYFDLITHTDDYSDISFLANYILNSACSLTTNCPECEQEINIHGIQW